MTDQHPDHRLAVIPVTVETTVSADQVIAAARDFSDRRYSVFPAVSAKHTTIHSVDVTAADVTEGTRAGPVVVWERCAYDWSQPGVVTATVIDSNVYGFPGSKWEITAVPTDTGSRVVMTWTRWFQRRPLGRFMGFAYMKFGEKQFAKYGRDIVANLEKLQPT
ncbi:MAG TPA: SRPBCC family protein [Acidimicrobiia bacterium]|nr:SRPBCC family protein [Acidimicrobiia bacterium]